MGKWRDEIPNRPKPIPSLLILIKDVFNELKIFHKLFNCKENEFDFKKLSNIKPHNPISKDSEQLCVDNKIKEKNWYSEGKEYNFFNLSNSLKWDMIVTCDKTHKSHKTSLLSSSIEIPPLLNNRELTSKYIETLYNQCVKNPEKFWCTGDMLLAHISYDKS